VTRRVIQGRAYVDRTFRDKVTIAMDDSTITDVKIGGDAEGTEVAGVILPGLIDVHVHGGAGADFMDGTPAAVETVVRFHARNGTAALAATTLSASMEDTARAIAAIEGLTRRAVDGCAEIAGIHLEGPYINPVKSGAQDRASIRLADLRELEQWIERAPEQRWMMTIAPEIEGSRALLEKYRNQVLFSIGHTDATYAEALEAVQHGARHFTHLFNAMPPFHHREPGVVGAALISLDCTAELIADGIHLHPLVLQTFARIMPDRVVLVTDAMRAAGLVDGKYKLYGYDVTVADGAARLDSGALAGSTLTMIRAVQNMVELAGLPLEQVMPLATENPARLLRLEKRKGKIEVAYDADLLVVYRRFEITTLFLRGQEIRAA
jgi:N-acetylglucosamine-6-phosphate deacetylase